MILVKYFGLILILISCAHIRPMDNKNELHKKKTPTQTINDFSYETDSLNLDKVVENDSIDLRDKKFLRDVKDEKVQFWINYFARKNPDRFQRFSRNGAKYRTVVEKIFTKYGLPKELYYVGIVESGFQNHAKSHAGAVGPWQFIKATGKRYGLNINYQIDERKNIYKSTEAAALYFQDLYNIFGSWELALAAYNAGEYGIIRRIRGANTREYYELSRQKKIPKETRNYVPKVLAVMHIDKNRSKFGLNSISVNDSFYTHAKSIKIKKNVDLNRLSKKIGLTKSKLIALNPDIRVSYVPGRIKNGVDLFVPTTTSFTPQTIKETIVKKERRTPKKLKKSKVSNQSHTVRANESLYAIAKRYNTNIKTLRSINRLKSSRIFPGQKLNLPFKQYSTVNHSHTVKRGDNLYKLSRIYKMSAGQLKKLNKLKSSNIRVGQKIRVPAHKTKVYTVKKGDVLSNIAIRNGVSLANLKLLNNSLHRIYPGQRIILSVTII